MSDDYLTVPQAAERLGRSGQFIRSLIARGHLPGAYEPLGAGRGWLVPRKSVELRKRQQQENRVPKGGRPRKLNAGTGLKSFEKSAENSR